MMLSGVERSSVKGAYLERCESYFLIWRVPERACLDQIKSQAVSINNINSKRYLIMAPLGFLLPSPGSQASTHVSPERDTYCRSFLALRQPPRIGPPEKLETPTSIKIFIDGGREVADAQIIVVVKSIEVSRKGPLPYPRMRFALFLTQT